MEKRIKGACLLKMTLRMKGAEKQCHCVWVSVPYDVQTLRGAPGTRCF